MGDVYRHLVGANLNVLTVRARSCVVSPRKRNDSSDTRVVSVTFVGPALVLLVVQAWPRRLCRDADQTVRRNVCGYASHEVNSYQTKPCEHPCRAVVMPM